jgi:hypothetical protein
MPYDVHEIRKRFPGLGPTRLPLDPQNFDGYLQLNFQILQRIGHTGMNKTKLKV